MIILRPLLTLLPMALMTLPALGQATREDMSRDATVITFASEIDGTLAIFEVRSDGNGLKEVIPATVARRGEYHPHVSRDGHWLSFTTYRYGGWKLALARRDGSAIRRLTPSSHYAYDGAFSPDGQWIAFRRVETLKPPWFRGNLEIFAIRTDGSEERNLTRSPNEEENPSYSSDGSKIVYQAWLNDTNNYEIFVMESDGSRQRNLTRSNAHEIAPAFSPDGSMIAFQRLVDDRLQLYVMASDGSDPRHLDGASAAAASEDKDSDAVWKYATNFSPDGKQIAFTGMARGDREIFIVNSDGTGLRRVTNHRGDDLHPVWTLR